MAKGKTSASHAAIAAADPKKPLRARMHSVDIEALQFYELLNNHIKEDVGDCPEGFKREIAWQTIPESGVVTVLVTDTPEVQPEDATVQ